MTMPHDISSTSLTDLPTKHDQLGTQPYAEALATYITECDTPLTVAIQGDWGSGKTSTMNMIKDQQAVKEAAMVIDFNTWQYSQFNMSESLVLALMAHLIEKISDENSEDTDSNLKKTKLLRSISKFFTSSAIAATDEVSKLVPFAQIFMAGAKEGIASLDEKTSEELEFQRLEEMQNVAKVVENLRAQIEEYVAQALGAKDLDRMIVFIDDLDRLDPERAVEVLEAIKVFLDVKKCVYVLAIDFNVVKQGVRKKFGADFDEHKAQAFFEKIIQVPFHLPVSSYNVDKLLTSILSLDGDAQEHETYVSLARTSVGNNPRALKRLAHTFSLLKRINANEISEGSVDTNLPLFAILCMQSAYPLFYREFEAKLRATNSSELGDYFSAILDDDAADSNSRWESWSIDPIDVELFKHFLSSFRELFAPNQGGDIDVVSLSNTMRLGAITSVGHSRSKQVGPSHILLGMDIVRQDLLEKGVDEEDLQEFIEIAETLEEKLGSGKFGVGIGIQREAKFYANPNAESSAMRGTIAEIRFNNNGFNIKMGRESYNSVRDGVVKDWISQFESVFGNEKVADRTIYRTGKKAGQKQTSNYQIELLQLRELNDDQRNTLVDLMTDAREVLAQSRGF